MFCFLEETDIQITALKARIEDLEKREINDRKK